MTSDTQPLALRRYALVSACIIASGLALRIEALNAGFMVDDYPQIAMRDGFYPVTRAQLDLFTFSHGASAENSALRAAGVFPWWSHPLLRISMLRPLSCALMWLDRALFGNDALAYHLHSALWWVAMTAMLAAVLRRALPGWAAPLALLLFVADEAHGSLLSWIAMRNATVASTFSLLGLWAQLRLRSDGARWGAPLAFLSHALALAAGEYALAFVGYALLLALSPGPELRSRLRRLSWPALLLLAYLGLRGLGRFGSIHSGIYLEPLFAPLEFARVALPRFLVLCGDLVAAIPASFWTWGVPWPLPWVQSGLVPWSWVLDISAARDLLQGFGVLALLFALWIGSRCLRATRARGEELRWLVFGTPLAILPVLCSFPENRLLVPAQVGWAAMLAYFVHASVAARAKSGRAFGPEVIAASGLALYHLVVPAAQAPAELRNTSRNASAMRASILAPALEDMLRGKRQLMLLSAADPTTAIYLPLVRKLHRRSAPPSCLLLSSSGVPQTLSRLSQTAFTLERTALGYTAADNYAAFFTDRPLRTGDRFSVDGMRVRVELAQDGRPLRTRFDFDSPLDDPALLFLMQTPRGLTPLPLPSVGGSVLVLPPVPTMLDY